MDHFSDIVDNVERVKTILKKYLKTMRENSVVCWDIPADAFPAQDANETFLARGFYKRH